MEEDDRISSLPDCLIVEILCRLESTKEAIRTSTLSKRWIHLWTLFPNLIFDVTKFPAINGHVQFDNFCSLVDQFLTQCGGKLKNLNKFRISVEYSPRFESNVNNWIHYAINRNVQEFHLLISYTFYHSYGNRFVLPQSIFNDACFTKLVLEQCIFNPSGSVTWKNLKSLSIFFAKLDEDLIQNILSGSPVLKTFTLKYCYGFKRIDITSKSVENLVLTAAVRMTQDVIEINAPYSLSLTLDGFSLTKPELKCQKMPLLLNVSSLIKAEFNCWKTGQEVKTPQEMPEVFRLNLHHVKELKLWGKVFTDSTFDWFYWPPARKPLSPETVEYIESLDFEEDIALLYFYGWSLPSECARTFRISTMLLKKVVKNELTPFTIGNIMCRENINKQSVIEKIVQEAEDLILPGFTEAAFIEAVSEIINQHLDSMS